MRFKPLHVRFAAVALLFTASAALAQPAQKPFEPFVGQPGKDVVWVPTSQALVDKMLDMAKLTATDVHMDLGSGDGRTVITAAKRGARSTGVEYNPDMVELSKAQCGQGRRGRQSDVRQSGPVRDRFLESHRHHAVPAARHQSASCARKFST